MRKVIGVDAGNSKTFALVAEEHGRVLGFGRAGPGNHQTVGPAQAAHEIRRACLEALSKADVAGPVHTGVFGLAGADLREDFALLEEVVQEIGVAERAQVENDTLVALRAGTSRPWGVVVVCGAGFNAAGIAPNGRVLRLPGLGWISGDRGGGSTLAREAVRRVARAWDGRGEETLLTRLVLKELKMKGVEQLISALYHRRIEEKKLLDLVPQVFEASYSGDAVAQEILIQLGEEAGITAGAVIRRLDLEGSDVEVVLAGGMFRGKGALLPDTVAQVVHRTAPQARLVRPRFPPVVGAVLLALEKSDVPVTTDIIREVERSLPVEFSEQAMAEEGPKDILARTGGSGSNCEPGKG